MKPMGRPPKPLEDHQLDGTYREDRHGDEGMKFRPDGYAEKPKDLGENGSALWDFIIDDLNRKNVAARIDSVKLGEACRWYQRYKKYSAVIDAADLTSKDSYRILISTKMCWEKFDNIASSFGLDPVSRMRLQIKTEKPSKSVMSRNREAS